jgi:hypothetical protein
VGEEWEKEMLRFPELNGLSHLGRVGSVDPGWQRYDVRSQAQESAVDQTAEEKPEDDRRSVAEDNHNAPARSQSRETNRLNPPFFNPGRAI